MSVKKLFALSLLFICLPWLGRGVRAQTTDRAQAQPVINSASLQRARAPSNHLSCACKRRASSSSAIR